MPAGPPDSSRCGRTGRVRGPRNSIPPGDAPTSTTVAPDSRLHGTTVEVTTVSGSEDEDEMDMGATFRFGSGAGAAAGEPQAFDQAARAIDSAVYTAARVATTADLPRRPCPTDP